MGQVVKVPNETIKLDCVISFSYGNYTISNNLKIELYGGSQSTAFAEGWIQIDSNHYKYSSNYTLTDNIDRPTQKNTTSGEINLENCILDYRTKTDRYVNGLFSYTSLSCSFHYNGITKTMDISDNTNSNNIKTKSIFLGTLYNSAYYDNDKNDGWDWKILNYVLKALKLFDKLLIESGKSVYVSALYTNGNYSTNYLFGLS